MRPPARPVEGNVVPAVLDELAQFGFLICPDLPGVPGNTRLDEVVQAHANGRERAEQSPVKYGGHLGSLSGGMLGAGG